MGLDLKLGQSSAVSLSRLGPQLGIPACVKSTCCDQSKEPVSKLGPQDGTGVDIKVQAGSRSEIISQDGTGAEVPNQCRARANITRYCLAGA